jgi:hypothetical protein
VRAFLDAENEKAAALFAQIAETDNTRGGVAALLLWSARRESQDLLSPLTLGPENRLCRSAAIRHSAQGWLTRQARGQWFNPTTRHQVAKILVRMHPHACSI